MFELDKFCPACGVDQPVEVPPCADGHGLDCPERACAECGTAVLVAPTPVVSRSSIRRAA